MAPSANTVPAVWSGPYEGDPGPGQPRLQPGDVVEGVSEEMLESGHWTAAGNAAPTVDLAGATSAPVNRVVAAATATTTAQDAS